MSAVKKLQNVAANKIMRAIALIAFTLAAIGANQLCMYWYHQPKMPEQVRMMKNR